MAEARRLRRVLSGVAVGAGGVGYEQKLSAKPVEQRPPAAGLHWASETHLRALEHAQLERAEVVRRGAAGVLARKVVVGLGRAGSCTKGQCEDKHLLRRAQLSDRDTKGGTMHPATEVETRSTRRDLQV